MFKGLTTALFLLASALALSTDAHAQPVVAEDKQIHLILSGKAPVYKNLYSRIKLHLTPQYSLTRSFASQDEQVPDSRILISLGSKAMAQMIAQKGAHIRLAILIPAQKFYSATTTNSFTEELLKARTLSAIFMDQPPDRQLNLARLINPALTSVGTIYDEKSRNIAMLLASSANRSGLEFHGRSLSQQDNPVAVLKEMYSVIDVFLAVPGQYIFNRSTAKWMLYLSYQNRKPLLGFSADYVKAGAFAAVYSDTDDLARQTADWLRNLSETRDYGPLPAYPSHFKVSINKQVAARLKLESFTGQQLKQQLLKMEELW